MMNFAILCLNEEKSHLDIKYFSQISNRLFGCKLTANLVFFDCIILWYIKYVKRIALIIQTIALLASSGTIRFMFCCYSDIYVINFFIVLNQFKIIHLKETDFLLKILKRFKKFRIIFNKIKLQKSQLKKITNYIFYT